MSDAFPNGELVGLDPKAKSQQSASPMATGGQRQMSGAVTVKVQGIEARYASGVSKAESNVVLVSSRGERGGGSPESGV